MVTGANRGLGLCFVETLLEFGAAKVYAAARDIDSLTPLVGKHAGKVVPLKLDVTSQADVDAVASAAADTNLLINNAGALVQRGLTVVDDLSGLELEMAVNVFGVARMCQAFAPIIVSNGGGIANMLSTASMVNFPIFGTYASSKAAAMSLTDCLRFEMRDQNVEVFGIYAGYIDTDMLGNVNADKTSPADVARNAILGIEDGVINIDTDERARNVRQGLQSDPAGVIATTWERAAEFRAANPT